MSLVGETVNLQFLVGGRPVGATNPLPIKGEVDAKLTSSNVRVVEYRMGVSTEVLAAGTNTITITPTTGYIGHIKALGVYSAAIAAAVGTQSFMVYVGAYSAYGAQQIYSIQSAANGAMINKTNNDLKTIVSDTPFSVTNPLAIRYENNTDKTQPVDTRRICVLYEEMAVTV